MTRRSTSEAAVLDVGDLHRYDRAKPDLDPYDGLLTEAAQ